MHTTTVIAAQPTQPVAVAATVPVTMNISVTRGLGIAQLTIGTLTLILGIAATAYIGSYWVNSCGGSIWGGGWIVITGILGIVSASQPLNSCLNGTHMAFCIISTTIAFFDGIIFVVAIVYYDNCKLISSSYYNGFYGQYTYYYYRRYSCHANSNVGRGLFGALVALMAAEVFIALIAAVFCCKSSSSCCRSPETQGVIIQQQQPQQFNVVTSSTGQQMMVPASTMQPVVYSSALQQLNFYPQQQMQSVIGQSQMQPMGMQQPMMGGNNTNITYSAEQKLDLPPPYYE